MKMNAKPEPALRFRFLALALLSVALLPTPGHAQTAPSAEEARFIEFGKEIFKSKAVCQYCHKWDASGDQGYGGNALSLRATQLTPEQMTEVVKCGRPATGMPYHDRFAYTDKRCYGYTREQMCARTIDVYEELLFPQPAALPSLGGRERMAATAAAE